MAYVVLARKWRPKVFEDLIGQEHISRSLQNALSQGKTAQAYLLAGTRGVGKTSCARIFAKALNCINPTSSYNPCNICENCLSADQDSAMDIQEIDGASHNSVDDVRSLIEKITYLPVQGKKNIFIIDEVHMLSTSAFNALLKTLEEPPPHVVFILATTEPSKVIDTVLSRVQRFDFRSLSTELIVRHLLDICSKEGISFESEGIIKRVAYQANGSLRDALSLLDQILTFAGGETITDEMASLSLGLATQKSIDKICQALTDGDISTLKNSWDEVLLSGCQLQGLADGLLDYYFSEIKNYSENNKTSLEELIWIHEQLSKDFDWILQSIAPKNALFVLLLKISKRRDFFKGATKKALQVNTSANHPSPSSADNERKSDSSVQPSPLVHQEPHKVQKITSWDDVLAKVQTISPVLAANLEQGNLLEEESSLVDGKITLGFKRSSQVFYDYLSDPQSLQKIRQVLAAVLAFKIEDLEIGLKLVSSMTQGQNFQSKQEQNEKRQEIALKNQEETIKSLDSVVYAEEIFNSKVKTVHFNKNSE